MAQSHHAAAIDAGDPPPAADARSVMAGSRCASQHDAVSPPHCAPAPTAVAPTPSRAHCAHPTSSTTAKRHALGPTVENLLTRKNALDSYERRKFPARSAPALAAAPPPRAASPVRHSPGRSAQSERASSVSAAPSSCAARTDTTASAASWRGDCATAVAAIATAAAADPHHHTADATIDADSLPLASSGEDTPTADDDGDQLERELELAFAQRPHLRDLVHPDGRIAHAARLALLESWRQPRASPALARAPRRHGDSAAASASSRAAPPSRFAHDAPHGSPRPASSGEDTPTTDDDGDHLAFAPSILLDYAAEMVAPWPARQRRGRHSRSRRSAAAAAAAVSDDDIADLELQLGGRVYGYGDDESSDDERAPAAAAPPARQGRRGRRTPPSADALAATDRATAAALAANTAAVTACDSNPGADNLMRTLSAMLQPALAIAAAANHAAAGIPAKRPSRRKEQRYRRRQAATAPDHGNAALQLHLLSLLFAPYSPDVAAAYSAAADAAGDAASTTARAAASRQ